MGNIPPQTWKTTLDFTREDYQRSPQHAVGEAAEKVFLARPTVILDGIPVGDDHPIYVIAECGHNHLGSVEECRRLFVMARDAGANAVKLQKRDNLALYTEKFFNSPYNSEAAYGPTYGTHREALEFSLSQYLELSDFAKQLNLTFIATPFDLPSVDFLETVNVPYYKVASGSITNPLLLRKIKSLGKPVVVSFGGASFGEVERAVRELAGCPLVLMHCTAEYPLTIEHANLGKITRLKEMFPSCVVGFSDHQDGISLGAVAYTLGARVFEKHVTMNHSNKGTDHSFSLEFSGLTQYIKYIRDAQIGTGFVEQPFEEEREPLRKMGGSLRFIRDMKAGDAVAAEDLTIKSPMDGLCGWDYDEVLGRRLIVDVLKEHPLDWSFFGGEY